MKKPLFALVGVFVAVLASLAEKLHQSLTGYMFNRGLMLGIDNSGMPQPGDFAKYRVTNPNSSEIVRQRLYDSLLYPLLGSLNLSFFSQAIGQGITTAPGAAVGGVKTNQDTNMDIANSLPSGKEYLMESLEVYIYPGGSAAASTFIPAYVNVTTTAALSAVTINSVNDVQALYESGLLQFKVLDKVQLEETPLRAFPPQNFLTYSAAMSTAVGGTTLEIGGQHLKADGRPYFLLPKISIQPATNFKVSAFWPGLVATPSGFNARMQVVFDGFLKRSAQ